MPSRWTIWVLIQHLRLRVESMSFLRTFAQRHRTELIVGTFVFLLLAAAYALDLLALARLRAADLLLTHDRRSDNIVIIAHGRVVAQGSPDALRQRAGQSDLEEAFVRIIGTTEGLE